MTDEQGSGVVPFESRPQPASPLYSFPQDRGLHLGAGGSISHDVSRPRTPEHQMGQLLDDARTPSGSPALPSPPMSFFGISPAPLSPLRRQFSSGLSLGLPLGGSARIGASDADSEMSAGDDRMGDDPDSEPDDLTQDRKDVLLDRLNDLAQRLSGDGNLEGTSIDSLHAKVDEMEQVLAGDGKAARPRKHRRRPLPGSLLGSPIPPAEPEQRETTPGWLNPRFSGVSKKSAPAVDGSLNGVDKAAEWPKVSAETASRLATEAQKLCDDLARAFSSLQTRREETEHLSGMLIERAEGAAKRILQLEDEISKLEYEIDGNESELKHLRLRLRAVEIVCYEYVPEDADPELLQSIENWKSDWATLKKNMTTRRRERHPHDDVPSAFSTPTASTL